MKIEMQPVTSSNIESVGYDAATQTLAVAFKHGGTYHYYEVPQDAVKSLLEAESIGKHFHAEIKGKFKAEKQEKKDNEAF